MFKLLFGVHNTYVVIYDYSHINRKRVKIKGIIYLSFFSTVYFYRIDTRINTLIPTEIWQPYALRSCSMAAHSRGTFEKPMHYGGPVLGNIPLTFLILWRICVCVNVFLQTHAWRLLIYTIALVCLRVTARSLREISDCVAKLRTSFTTEKTL